MKHNCKCVLEIYLLVLSNAWNCAHFSSENQPSMMHHDAVLTMCTTQQFIRVHHFSFTFLMLYRKQLIVNAYPQQQITGKIVLQWWKVLHYLKEVLSSLYNPYY